MFHKNQLVSLQRIYLQHIKLQKTNGKETIYLKEEPAICPKAENPYAQTFRLDCLWQIRPLKSINRLAKPS